MVNFGAYACCKLCFRDLCLPRTCFFASSTLEMGGGVFKCLSEAKKLNFRPKTAILGRFFMKNVCCKLCFRDLFLSRTCFFASNTLKIGRGVFNCLSEAEKLKC